VTNEPCLGPIAGLARLTCHHPPHLSSPAQCGAINSAQHALLARLSADGFDHGSRQPNLECGVENGGAVGQCAATGGSAGAVIV
jgi:hypothetical protein